jgi:hypothetical protein
LDKIDFSSETIQMRVYRCSAAGIKDLPKKRKTILNVRIRNFIIMLFCVMKLTVVYQVPESLVPPEQCFQLRKRVSAMFNPECTAIDSVKNIEYF